MITWPEGTTGRVSDTIDSTNAEAARRVAASETGPIWIASREQSAGRGRQGRVWQSPPGNLSATYLAPFTGAPGEAALTGFAAALAVADTLSRFAPTAEIRTKWPNDVLLNGAKTSGILLESYAGTPLILATGIGINLVHAPPAHETRWHASSLAAETGRAPDFEEAVETLAHALDHWLTRLGREGFAAIREAWLARATHLGRPIEVRLPAETLTGRFLDLDADGALVLDTRSQRRRIAAGDVFLPGVG